MRLTAFTDYSLRVLPFVACACAMDAFHEVLDACTLEDLLANRTQLSAVMHAATPLQ